MSPQETPPALKIMDEPVLRELPPSAHSSGVAGGIYHTRSRTLPPRSSIEARILHRQSQTADAEVVQDIEEGDDWRDGQEKQKQVFKGWTLLWYVVMPLPLTASRQDADFFLQALVPVDRRYLRRHWHQVSCTLQS